MKILFTILLYIPLWTFASCGLPLLPDECDLQGNCRPTLQPSSNETLNVHTLAKKKSDQPLCLMAVAPSDESKQRQLYADSIRSEVITHLQQAAAKSRAFADIPPTALTSIRLKVLASGNVEKIDVVEYYGYTDFDDWLLESMSSIGTMTPDPSNSGGYSLVKIKIVKGDLKESSKLSPLNK